ncbi:AzlC family ABC transporter permease [Herbaspirillum sp. YR522]|uniref:AzlC family ABC transporter permease n=1 Tax=Herbaspirillum sp. YR522 TaxID=1144342 RepID=UPI00026F9A32|nr:AzlC family ABC transporter permease [Herbaspirillum sp. YR522]EJM98244.1 putative branched-chain amino acid permease (azaleucine resistance) [Herbaspirillum sp. YR522]
MHEETRGAALADARRIEKEAFQEGWRASASTVAAVFAWGVVSGMAMVKSGMSIFQSLGMSLMVFAGSAQFAVLPLLVAGAPLLVVFFTAMIVNLRFVIFSAAIAPHFEHLPWYRRIWYGYFNGDIAMGFFPRRFGPDTLGQPAGKIGYFSAISYPGWLGWQLGAVIGILLASQIPESWNIGFAGTLALIAIMIPMTNNLAALAGVVVSGAVAVLAIGLPYRLGLLLAMVLGMAAALVADKLLFRNASDEAGT